MKILNEMTDNEFCDILQLITHYDGKRNLRTKIAIQDTVRFLRERVYHTSKIKI